MMSLQLVGVESSHLYNVVGGVSVLSFLSSNSAFVFPGRILWRGMVAVLPKYLCMLLAPFPEYVMLYSQGRLIICRFVKDSLRKSCWIGRLRLCSMSCF